MVGVYVQGLAKQDVQARAVNCTGSGSSSCWHHPAVRAGALQSADIEDYLATIGRWQAKTQMVDALRRFGAIRAEWLDVVQHH